MKVFKNIIFKISLFSAMVLLLSFSLFFASTGKWTNNTSYAAGENQSETSEFLQNLTASNESLGISYMQSADYVLDAENQLSTDFCWLFASLKCLESSYMIQKNEYYNFSETGMAYLNYVANISNNQSTFNTTGNLLKFNNLANSAGLVFENDVSNDLLWQINESNYKNYSHISSLASKNLIENVKVVSFGENPYFSGLSYNQQILTMKNFIKNYGALFIAFGEGDGVIFKTLGFPQYDYSSAEHLNDEYVSINRHSVCLIGWNAIGFIALNSWGDASGAYQTFCIPYATAESKLDELMSTVRGFVIEDNSNFGLASGGENSQKNIFNTQEDVILTYDISRNYDINNISVEIFKGSEDATFDFNIIFDDEGYQIKVIDKFENQTDNHGGYVVRFYQNKELIAHSSFAVLSGTEIANVALLRKQAVGSYVQEDLSIINSFLTANNTATYILDPYDDYKIKISLSSFSKCVFDENDPYFGRYQIGGADKLFEISSVKVQTIISSGVVWSETSLIVSKSTIDYDTNTFEFMLPNFDGLNEKYKNKLLSFDITINSTTGSDSQTKLTFMVFVGNNDGDNTSQNLSINYQLDGGKNSEQNIVSFPNYQNNSSMTEVILNSPSKSGYEFLGWFRDKQFANQVYKISGEFSSDIVLYAKWDSANVVDYVLTEIEMNSLKNSDGGNKDVELGVEYGDVVSFVYKFLPQSQLVKYNYTARLIAYYFKAGEKIYVKQINNLTVDKQSQIMFRLGYPDLEFGNYNLIIETYISINNVANIDSVAYLNFSVAKRQIELEYENLNFVYDGEYHFPTITPKAGDVFDEDLEEFYLNYSISSQKNAGIYTANISSANQNYQINENFKQCDFEISQKELSIVWINNELLYNTFSQAPSFEIEGIVLDDSVAIRLKTLDAVNVGNYLAEIDINSVSDSNYYVKESSQEFKIVPAKVKVIFNDITERLKVAPNYRKQPTFEVGGDLFVGVTEEREQQIIALMELDIICDALNATEFGKYKITAVCASQNFDAEIVEATYNLIAPYKVVYTLPDGTIYVEQVEENGQPKGINRDIYAYTIFQVPEYSRALYGDGTENLYISVAIKDYTILVVVLIVVVLFVVVYLIMTHKQRKNKVS